ncbi:MAG: hypothetical protein ACP5U1_02700 [Desulfomonilaceae bacterium]
MKKSLVMLVVVMGSLALVSSVFATDWGCFSTPTCKPAPCKDEVLCKGKAKGIEKMCGPCAPTIKWSGSWMTVLKCPASAKAAPAKIKKVKRAVKKSKKK